MEQVMRESRAAANVQMMPMGVSEEELTDE